MKYYESRYSKELNEKIINDLCLDSLIKSAYDKKNPLDLEESKYKKIATIDYAGLSGSILFDLGGMFSDPSIAKKLQETIKNIKTINDQGIAVRFRLLFVYPFSDYTYSILQAENSRKRTTIDEPLYYRSFDLVDEIDERTFWGSMTVRNLNNSLKTIHSYINEELLSFDNEENKVMVRFTTSSLNVSILKINNNIYSDAYILTKKNINSDKLLLNYPMLCANETDDVELFNSLAEHWRYLWTLDSTMISDDATYYKSNKKDGLKRIKDPKDINYNCKATFFNSKSIDNEKNSLDEIALNKWKASLVYVLKNNVREVISIPTEEKIFITCSWEYDEKKGKTIPNEYAFQLSKWLKEDFFDKGAKTNIVQVGFGEELSKKIYSTMLESTLTIAILKNDITEKKNNYSRPNVYHEIGFFLRHYGLENSKKILVLVEDKVIIPSNINNFVYFKFDSKKYYNAYFEVLKWLSLSSQFISSKDIQKAEENHKLRIDT